MDLGSFFAIGALAVLVAMFVSRPFFGKTQNQKLVSDRVEEQALEHERSALLAEHDRVLTALQELEFDYALGKIPEEDYPSQRAILLQIGASTLRKLDAIQPPSGRETAEARIEAAIASRRADGNRHPANGDDDLEHLIAGRRRERQGKSAGFCSRCGSPLQSSDHFCPKCGIPVT
jgi:hypothetical protein